MAKHLVRIRTSGDRITVIDPPHELAELLGEAVTGASRVVRANKRDYSLVVPLDPQTKQRLILETVNRLRAGEGDAA
jgi:hypothetical protein